MILPTKHIPENRSLLGVGGAILELLSDRAFTVSSLWENLRTVRSEHNAVSFDWFILSLDLLYMTEALEFEKGLIKKKQANDI